MAAVDAGALDGWVPAGVASDRWPAPWAGENATQWEPRPIKAVTLVR